MRFSAFFRSLFALQVLWTCAFLLAVAAPVVAPATSAQDLFQTGVGAFQKTDLKLARASFQEALKSDPSNPVLLFNLATVVQKDGQLGLALALWRKALAIQPDFSAAQRAISWAEAKLDRREIPHDVEFWESLRDLALIQIPLDRYLGTTAFLFLIAGWLCFRYLGQRRRAILEDRPLPNFPSAALASSLLLFVAAILSAAKLYDQSIMRGTITVKKIEARSSPDSAATALFDLYEGLEVIVRNRTEEWTQITYPGASTGWIPKSAVFTTADGILP